VCVCPLKAGWCGPAPCRMLTAWQIMTANSPQPSILPSGLLPACLPSCCLPACLLLCLPACLHCLHAFVPALHACVNVNVRVYVGGSGWQQRRRLGKIVARLKKPISSLHPRNILTQTTYAHTHHHGHHQHHHVWKCSHVHKRRTQLRVCMHVRAEGRSQRKAQVPNERTRAQVAPGRRFRPAGNLLLQLENREVGSRSISGTTLAASLIIGIPRPPLSTRRPLAPAPAA